MSSAQVKKNEKKVAVKSEQKVEEQVVKEVKPKAEKVEKPKAEKPKAEKVEKPKAEKVEKPKAEKEVKVKVEKVEKPKSDDDAEKVKEKRTRVRKPKAEKSESGVEVVKVERRKTPATDETVMSDVLSLLEGLTSEKLGELDNQKQAVRLLKQTASRLKNLRNDLTRVLRKTKRNTAPKDKSKLSNSGLMKPVVISKDLADFMKVSGDSLHSRVSVTNAICTYIKEHNLQNPNNKREIMPDRELAKILNYNPSVKQPLTYFYIQQLIQPHFLKGVSHELARFMKVSEDSLHSSSAVNDFLKSYVASKGLAEDDQVKLDETLSKLLGKSGSVPAVSLNQLVKIHFKK